MILLKTGPCEHMHDCDRFDALWFECFNKFSIKQEPPELGWFSCTHGTLQFSVFNMPDECREWRRITTEEFGLVAGALDAWTRAIDNWEPE